MKTTLSADGNIHIPEEIRQVDHLSAGDSFEMERVTAGHYLLKRQLTQPPHARRFTVATAEDGLPVIALVR